jgi:toxin HigB-1
MIIEFEKEYLKCLYEEGKTNDKKHRFQPSVIKQYKNTIDKLKVAKNIEELFLLKSLNYEKLIGNKKELESVKVNQKYRIEFETRVKYKEPVIIYVCSIIELSNHYK